MQEQKEVCVVQKCLKTINAKLPEIMSKKGCDASNVYDEEIREQEYFSDDEQERAAKNKNKKKRAKKNQPELEDGEISGPTPQQNKK